MGCKTEKGKMRVHHAPQEVGLSTHPSFFVLITKAKDNWAFENQALSKS